MGGQRRQPQLFCLPGRFAIQIQRCLLPSSVRASASPIRPTLGTTSSDGLSISRVCQPLTSLSFPAPSALTFMNEDGRLCHRNRRHRHRLWENEMRVRSSAATELLSVPSSLPAGPLAGYSFQWMVKPKGKEKVIRDRPTKVRVVLRRDSPPQLLRYRPY